MKDLPQYTFKKGDLVRVSPSSPWQTAEFEWDSCDIPPKGQLGIVLGVCNASFSTAFGYNTWTVRLSDGTLGIYPEKELLLLANS
tara:strand:+ start:1759 stop:2013 length:255 start_codon:yes stop_codon:yes gene_type:complete